MGRKFSSFSQGWCQRKFGQRITSNYFCQLISIFVFLSLSFHLLQGVSLSSSASSYLVEESLHGDFHNYQKHKDKQPERTNKAKIPSNSSSESSKATTFTTNYEEKWNNHSNDHKEIIDIETNTEIIIDEERGMLILEVLEEELTYLSCILNTLEVDSIERNIMLSIEPKREKEKFTVEIPLDSPIIDGGKGGSLSSKQIKRNFCQYQMDFIDWFNKDKYNRRIDQILYRYHFSSSIYFTPQSNLTFTTEIPSESIVREALLDLPDDELYLIPRYLFLIDQVYSLYSSDILLGLYNDIAITWYIPLPLTVELLTHAAKLATFLTHCVHFPDSVKIINKELGYKWYPTNPSDFPLCNIYKSGYQGTNDFTLTFKEVMISYKALIYRYEQMHMTLNPVDLLKFNDRYSIEDKIHETMNLDNNGPMKQMTAVILSAILLPSRDYQSVSLPSFPSLTSLEVGIHLLETEIGRQKRAFYNLIEYIINAYQNVQYTEEEIIDKGYSVVNAPTTERNSMPERLVSLDVYLNNLLFQVNLYVDPGLVLYDACFCPSHLHSYQDSIYWYKRIYTKLYHLLFLRFNLRDIDTENHDKELSYEDARKRDEAGTNVKDKRVIETMIHQHFTIVDPVIEVPFLPIAWPYLGLPIFPLMKLLSLFHLAHTPSVSRVASWLIPSWPTQERENEMRQTAGYNKLKNTDGKPNFKETNQIEKRLNIGIIGECGQNTTPGLLFENIIKGLTKSELYQNVYYFNPPNTKTDFCASMLNLQNDMRILNENQGTGMSSTRITSFEYIQLSLSLDASAKVIAEKELDFLLFLGIGMCPFTYYLSFSRLASVQAILGHAHPITSGHTNTVDYFISSTNFEYKLYSGRTSTASSAFVVQDEETNEIINDRFTSFQHSQQYPFMLADIFTEEAWLANYRQYQSHGLNYHREDLQNVSSEKAPRQEEHLDEILSYLQSFPTYYSSNSSFATKDSTFVSNSSSMTKPLKEDQYTLNEKMFANEYNTIYHNFTGHDKQEFTEQLVLFDTPTIGPIQVPAIDISNTYNHSYNYFQFHDTMLQQNYTLFEMEPRYGSKYEFLSALFAKSEEALMQKGEKKKFELKDLNKSFNPEKVKQKITAQNHIFTCLQHAKKFHPDFDQILINLLLQDPDAILILLESYQKTVLLRWPAFLKGHFMNIVKTENADAKDEEMERIVKEYVDASLEVLCERIVFIQRVSREDLLLVLSTTDVMLDTFPWGAGLTSLEAFTFGIPVMIYPKGTNVLQLALGQYRRMELFENKETQTLQLFIASSIEDYVKKTISLAKNKILLEEVKQEILKNVHKLFEYNDVVDEWNKFILSVCDSNKS